MEQQIKRLKDFLALICIFAAIILGLGMRERAKSDYWHKQYDAMKAERDELASIKKSVAALTGGTAAEDKYRVASCVIQQGSTAVNVIAGPEAIREMKIMMGSTGTATMPAK